MTKRVRKQQRVKQLQNRQRERILLAVAADIAVAVAIFLLANSQVNEQSKSWPEETSNNDEH